VLFAFSLTEGLLVAEAYDRRSKLRRKKAAASRRTPRMQAAKK
jgi:hypothetical protein